MNLAMKLRLTLFPRDIEQDMMNMMFKRKNKAKLTPLVPALLLVAVSCPLALAEPAIPQIRISTGIPAAPIPRSAGYEEFEKLHNRPESDNKAIVTELRPKLSELTYPYLYEYARRIADSDPEEAMIAFWRAEIRARYDAFRCTDATARQGISVWPQIARNVTELMKLPQYKARANEFGLRAIALEKNGPLGHKPTTICLHGIQAVIAGLEKKPYENWYVPETNWPKIHEEVLAMAKKSFTEPEPSGAADFTVTGETILESGVHPDPHAITQTRDGGYVIAGSIPNAKSAWATKTNAAGKMEWRYLVPTENNKPGSYPEFWGAAPTADGGVLLCGHMYTETTAAGLLVRLDKTGKLLSKTEPLPQEDQSFNFSRLDKCAPWGAGVAIVGHSSRSWREEGQLKRELFYWLLALHADGTVKWERMIRSELNNIGSFSQLLVMPNGDLVFSAFRQSVQGLFTEVVRVTPTGEVAAKKKLDGLFKLVLPIVAEPTIRLIGYPTPVTDMPWDNGPAALLTLNPKLEEAAKPRSLPQTRYDNNYVYLLPDQSLVKFGYTTTDANENVAGMIRFSPELKAGKGFLFQLGGIRDAVPTGQPGGFAAARKFYAPPSSGIALTFIRVK